MGRYDEITPESLRADIRRFADLILRLDEEGELLRATPRLLKMLGELRSKMFAYEVRCTEQLAPHEEEPPEIREARRIVDEAIQRAREAEEDWDDGWNPGGESR